MADDLLMTPSRRGLRALPVVLRIALIYLAARVITTAFLLLAASLSGTRARFGPGATIGDFLLGWDAQWYWLTAVNGYPATLPLTDGGLVAENQWAFMPVYAYLSAAVGGVLGSWGAGAVALSVVSGFFSCVVLYRMLRDRLGEGAALWAVIFFSCAPLAAMFQVGYAESLFLLGLLLALGMVQRRQYGWLYLIIPLSGFTRPGVLAFALFLGLYGIWRWMRRRSEFLSSREVVHIIALAVIATVVGFAWQVIAAAVTGVPDAYLATELSWRRNWLPDAEGVFWPFDGFISAAAFWFESWGWGAPAGYAFLALIVVGFASLLLFSRSVRCLGMEIRLWSASYALYLLAVFFPQSSLFRLLLPLSPLWGAVAVPRSTVWRGAILAVSLLGQWWWIYNMYAVGNTYWQIP